MRTLSKSDFKLARTCPAKLYYRELGYPDTQRDDPYLDLLAEGGYMVELLAKQAFPDGISLRYGGDPEGAARETAAHLARMPVTLFEATLLHGCRLARVDVLRRTRDGFDLYEVKSSTIDMDDARKRIDKTGSAFRSLKKPHDISSDWREYLEDVTYQVAILKDLYPGVPVRAHLVLVDKGKVVPFDGMPHWFRIVRGKDDRVHTAEFVGDSARAQRAGLTITLDVSAEVAVLEPEIRDAAREFVASISPDLSRMKSPLGRHCRDCEFRVEPEEGPSGFLECWGERGRAQPHVLELYQGRDFLDELIADGLSGIREIDDERLGRTSGSYGARQRVQVECARNEREWFDAGLADVLSSVRYPLHFLDFEAAGLAIPHHSGMRPYGRIAWQWSCHSQERPGAKLVHREFLNVDPAWPNEAFARALREGIGDEGTVLAWSHFESAIMRGVAEELNVLGPDRSGIARWLGNAATTQKDGGRVVDLLDACRKHYCHPMMGGSNSIKAVLTAIWATSKETRRRFAEVEGHEGDPDLGPYAALPPIEINGVNQVVAEGTGAIRAYFAMVYGVERDEPETRARWSRLLLDYCRLDTLAMVLIWEHWLRGLAPRRPRG